MAAFRIRSDAGQFRRPAPAPPSALPGTFSRKREKERTVRLAGNIDPSPVYEGRCRQAEGGSNKINALREISSGLIPAPPPRANLPLSRAPKRDHDEWLVRWMVGWFGSRSGPGLKYLGMGQFAGQAAANARGVRCRALQGARPPCIRRPGEVGNAGSPGLSGHPCFPRCGTGCSRARVP